jgi:hypothetical protein
MGLKSPVTTTGLTRIAAEMQQCYMAEGKHQWMAKYWGSNVRNDGGPVVYRSVV